MWVGTVHAVHLFRRAHYYFGGRADDHGYAVATTPCGRLRRARDGACPLPPRVAVCQGEHFAQYCRGLPVAVHSVLTSPAEFARLTPAVLSLTGASNLANEFFGHHAHLAPLAIDPAAVLRRVECDPSGCAGHQGAPSAAPLSPPSVLATARSRPAIVPCVLRTRRQHLAAASHSQSVRRSHCHLVASAGAIRTSPLLPPLLTLVAHVPLVQPDRRARGGLRSIFILQWA